jgi:hypothetical protein
MDNKCEIEGKNDFNVLNYMLSKLTQYNSEQLNIKNNKQIGINVNICKNTKYFYVDRQIICKLINYFNYYKPKICYFLLKIGYCSIKVICHKNHIWH